MSAVEATLYFRLNSTQSYQSIQSDNHAIGRLSSNASPIYSHLQHWPEFWGIIANHKIFNLNISNSGSWSDNRSTNQWWENVCWEVWTGKSTFDKLKQKLNAVDNLCTLMRISSWTCAKVNWANIDVAAPTTSLNLLLKKGSVNFEHDRGQCMTEVKPTNNLLTATRMTSQDVASLLLRLLLYYA